MLVAVFSVTVVSPGPDFIMELKNSLSYGRRSGVMTAIGFGLGIIVHVTYTLVGLAVLISHSIVLFSIIKYIGTAYLFYIGYKSLRSSGWKDCITTDGKKIYERKSDFSSIRDGFITNLFNPKATLFFLALFTQFLTQDMKILQKLILGGTCSVMVTAWFTIVATFMTLPTVRAYFARISRKFDLVCGTLLIVLGIKLATSSL